MWVERLPDFLKLFCHIVNRNPPKIQIEVKGQEQVYINITSDPNLELPRVWLSRSYFNQYKDFY